MTTLKQGSGPRQQVLELMRLGRFDQAMELCRQLLSRGRGNAQIFYFLGAIHGEKEEYADAAAAFRKSLELRPGIFLTWKGLGTALAMQGDFAGAESALREALALQPGNPDVLLSLAATLGRLNRIAESEDCFRQVLKARPDSADVLAALGDIRYHRKHYAEAADYYRRALQLEPDGVDANFHLGHCLQLLGQCDEAIKHLKKTVELDPGRVDALTAMGNAYISKGDPDGARSAFKRILKFDPDNVTALTGELIVLERAGDFRAVYENLLPMVRRAVEHPDLADLYLKICLEFDCCDAAIEYAEQVLEHAQMASETRAHLHFSLGRRYDRLGSYDLAFGHYQRANSLQTQEFDAVVHAATVDAIIKVFSWQFFSSAPRATVRSNRPVFIVGMPRSGTTLVEQILASHPDIFGAGELWDMHFMAQALQAPGEPARQYPLNCSTLTESMLDGIANRYLGHLDELCADALRVTDKLPVNFFYLGLIALAFPEARVIHCTRDPRDTCLSIYFQEFSASHAYFNNLEHIGCYYRDYYKLMAHFAGLLDIPLLEVRYEDLVADHEAVSHRLVDFAGLDWDDRCLAFHSSRRLVKTPSYDQVRQPIYTTSIGRWKNYESHLGPLLAALGAD